MFSLLWILSVLLITGIDGIFVSVGNYSEHRSAGVNLPECGLGYLPIILNTKFGKTCFYPGFPDKITLINKNAYKTGPIHATNRILNGRDGLIGESPWTVYLLINGYIHCTGVLLTFEWIMTASHCIDSMTFYAIAYAGSNTRKGGEQIDVNKAKLFKHPYYIDPIAANMTGERINITRAIHDIGLVKLFKKFTRHLNDGKHYLINTVCLPKANQTNENIEYATITGFGKREESSNYPKTLQIGTVRLAPYLICYRMIKKMFCTYIGANDLRGCSGDSGGPLVQYDRKDLNRAILAGIWRGSYSNCTVDNPTKGFWTAPTFYIPWILETIGGN